MTAADGRIPDIEHVDAFARQLYRRARAAGSDFAELATAVHSLHTALKHLHAEAQDRDSPLHQPGPVGSENWNAAHIRQLTSLVEDSDFSLKQVDTILEKYGDSAEKNSDARNSAARRDANPAEKAQKINLIRENVVSQKMKIDIFLDTIQLHSATKTQLALENADDQQLNVIKDKVDAISNRIFRSRNRESSFDETEDDLWQNFEAELEQEGFSPEVLRNNKEALRAYIRELESHKSPGDGSLPSVNGLLEYEAQPQMTVASALGPDYGELRPNSANAHLDNEGRRRAPDSVQIHGRFQLATIPDRSPRLASEQIVPSQYSDSEASPTTQAALISTKELMALDGYDADRAPARLSSLHLPSSFPPSYSISPGSSPSNRYLPPGAQPLWIPGSGPLSQNAQLSVSPGRQYLGTSPQAMQLPPAYSALSPDSSTLTPPPPYGTSPTLPGASSGAALTFPTLRDSAPAASNEMLQHQQHPRHYSHLAPDGKGQSIPLDAKWTKIDRKLVSPEVLHKAGVRYEARPTFVAVLGVLTREQIEEYARQSFQVRNARNPPRLRRGSTEKQDHDRPHLQTYGERERRRGGGDSARDGDWESFFEASDVASSEDDEDRRRRAGRSQPRSRYTAKDHASDKAKGREDKDEENGIKIYPVIVSPPASVNGDTISPSSTVEPKPILKNKNPNHVRFDPEGPREISPGSYGSYPDRIQRDRVRERQRGERERDQKHDRDRERDRDRDRSRREGSRERPRDRDRDRDRDHDHRDPDRRSLRGHHDRDRDRERDRDRNRDQRGRETDDRAPSKRSALKETAGAIGLSGAAATLLSVLAEAVEHL
ncbi:hypothetical protein VTK56DRAFT_7917 [Thermocarpiscus australiensis]